MCACMRVRSPYLLFSLYTYALSFSMCAQLLYFFFVVVVFSFLVLAYVCLLFIVVVIQHLS